MYYVYVYIYVYICIIPRIVVLNSTGTLLRGSRSDAWFVGAAVARAPLSHRRMI